MRLTTLIVHSTSLSDTKVSELQTAIIEHSRSFFINLKTVPYESALLSEEIEFVYVIWIDLRPDAAAGFELLERIKSDQLGRKFYFILSGESVDDDLRLKALVKGAFDFIAEENWSETIPVLAKRIEEHVEANRTIDDIIRIQNKIAELCTWCGNSRNSCSHIQDSGGLLIFLLWMFVANSFMDFLKRKK